MSVKLLQDQVDLNLGCAAGSLRKWYNFLGHILCDFFETKNPNNTVSRVNAYAKQYVSRRNGGTVGSYGGGGGGGRS
jgi:hypothetical protein